ncbi:MAG: class E sortase [Acidimicrobiales bacterium]
MPTIGVDKIVVNGVRAADLRRGPGQYPGAAQAGTAGNTAVAGHRTTYGAPFNRIDELRPGDEIHVTNILGRFTYRVMAATEAFADDLDRVDGADGGHIIVRPGATWVLDDFGDDRLTLTACHPKLSSRQRIIVAAALVDEPTAVPDPPAAVTAAAQQREGGSPATRPAPADLDEGLSGERGTLPWAALWLVAATLVWVGVGAYGRRHLDDRRWRIALRAASLVPVAGLLWFAFEMTDRALPAA